MEWKERYTKISTLASLFIFAYSVIYMLYFRRFTPISPYWIPMNQKLNSTIGLLLLLSITPIAINQQIKDIWLESVDHNVPRFLKDVTEDVKSGQSLIYSLQDNAKQDYGSITKPLQKALTHFKLTADFSASMKMLGNSLQRPVAKQMSAILMEAYSSGGSVREILESSVNLFISTQDNRINRKIKTKPYIIVVYISLFLFLAVSWIILNRFLIPMSIQTKTITDVSGIKMNFLSMEYYRSILYWSAITEGLIGGLVAGKISKGKISSGLIHSVILLTISIIFFTLII